MKISEQWLREWVDAGKNARRLAEQLTLAGLEVESVRPSQADFHGVVVAEVLETLPHPQADKLKVCRVRAGKKIFQIVCGAANVHTGMRAPLAVMGAKLPNGLEVKSVNLRGVTSSGMLCSAKELGLSDDASGLLQLPADAPVGKSLSAYLNLPDTVLDIKLTPNRGDCLSVAGLAREVAAINHKRLKQPRITACKPRSKMRLPVAVRAAAGCPLYTGRVIEGLKPDCTTPAWMTERLRRAGMRPISPVVDVSNYVMLELGQPLHAFDLRQLHGGIVVRWAKQGEALTLLDGRTIQLTGEALVIADHKSAKALAGVMGGQDSGVSASTSDIFIESAFFTPQAVAGKARRYGLVSEAAHRFERGVDPALPRRALERATQLLLAIAGGRPGPVVQAKAARHVPKPRSILLRRERLAEILGVTLPEREVEGILSRLGMRLQKAKLGWRVTTPCFRFDLAWEEDLIEEVGRIHGYANIPSTALAASMQPGKSREELRDPHELRGSLLHRGYTEVITYSFVPAMLDEAIAGKGAAAELENPISSDMSRLRRSLWPGLIQTLQFNLNRQQERIRIFELGRRYIMQDNDIKEDNYISGLAYGPVEPEQWGIHKHPIGFEDMKSDVEALFATAGTRPSFVPGQHQALHPGKSAAIHLGNARVGWLGELHPVLVKTLGIPGAAVLFEVAQEAVSRVRIPVYEPISRYPMVRRDIAVIIPEQTTADELQACIREAAPKLLQEVRIFDIYRGSGIDSGRKSVALGLILQDSSRTLTDEDADAIMFQVTSRLRQRLGATIRD
ncbi:MAG: phenylalanine--tRNA ligase subunit beta [Gammaproteobacteria bacterium]|nr:phenylalanine--tRNA ligase subunit beta [Gammaproteobacteria bacterium]